MALHSKSQFAKLCGLTTGNLTNYIKRGKIILSGDYVDDTIQENKDFLEKRQDKVKAISNEPEPDKTPEPLKFEIKGSVEKPKREIKQPNVKSPERRSQNDLEREKLELEIEKKQEDIEIARIKKEKMMGVLIPTDLVKVIFGQHFKSVTTSFKNAADNIIINIAKKKDLSRNEVAELRGELVEVLNIAVNDAVAESKKNISNIVTEYSEKRDVGERI